MRGDVKYTTSSHSEPSRRYHNLLYIPFESGYDSSSGVSASSSSVLSPIEYIIYPIGLRKGQVRKLDHEYERFSQIYQEIIIRLDRLETLLSDAERVLDVTRISQVHEELRSVRTQLDDILNLGQELVSRSEKYSKLVAPDIETITRKFEDLQHRIRIIQDRVNIQDRPEYEEIERIIRETEERAYIVEKTDVEQARRIREKIRRLKECLENLRSRSDEYEIGDEIIRFNERHEEHIRTIDRTVPREREFDSDFIFDVDDTRSVISEPAPHFNKYRKTVHSLERYRRDDHNQFVPTHEEYQLQPLLRVRSLKAIDHRTISAPSSPILQPRYRSYERSNVQYTKQSSNQQGYQDHVQSSISKSASMPNGGFPLQQNLLPHPPPPPPHFYPQQPMVYRERIIDKHVAERSTSRGESHRQHHQESSGHVQQQHARSASASGQSQAINRSIPVRYESSNANANAAAASSSGSFRQASGGFSQEQYPSYFHSEQHAGSSSNAGAGGYRQQHYDQQTHIPQPVGRHPTRIVN